MILNPAQRPAWSRYVIAVLAVALAAAVRAWPLGVLGTRAPFLTFYPAVILAALGGGLAGGLLATALSALLVSVVWMEPVGQFSIRDPADWLAVGVFVASCATISWVTQAMQRAQARASEAEAQVKLAMERSRTEEGLRRYELLAEHSRDIILHMRRDDGRILEANAAAANAYGYTRGELQSLSIHELRAAGARGLTASQMAEADTGGILFETVHRRKDGSTFPVEVSSQGATIGGRRTLISVIRDVTERKRDEEALRRSEASLRGILDATQESVWLFDPDGVVLMANETALLRFGKPAKEVVGKHFDEILPVELARSRLARLKEVVESGRPVELEDERGGISFQHSFYPVPDAKGCVTCVACFSRDITAGKRAEEALREGEARFRRLVKLAPIPLCFVNRDGELSYVNDRFVEAFGYTHDDVPTLKKWWQLAYPDERYRRWVVETWESSVRRAAETKRDIEPIEYAVTCKSGTVRRVVISGITLEDSLLATFLDITERKQAEEALRESEERYRSMFRNMAEGFALHEIVAGPDGAPCDYRFLDVNPGFERLTGLKAADVIGRTVREVLPGIEPRWIETYGRVALTGEPATFESHAAALDRWFEVFAYRPAPWHFAVIFMDVTARKRAEERLREAQKLESLGLVAGGVAHDFNNLLVGVIGNASLAKEFLPPGSPASDLLDGVIGAGEQAAHLTRQMLAYSGKGKFLVEALDLSALIPEMIGLVRPSMARKIVLSLDLDQALPPIEADRGQVQQVFMNLALNAAEAIGSHEGLITVRTGVQDVDESYVRRQPETASLLPGKYVCLEVRDTGCGMDDATKARVFDPFFSTKFVGRGLGLAAVAGVVRGHQGAITVTSAPGKGSIFTVLFPASGRVPAATPVPPVRGALLGSGTVLVVDDEEVVRTIAKRALERYGYQVLAAESGMAAIDILKRHDGEIAVVILDLSMPGMSGEEALPELRRIRPEVKVLISSGYSEAEAMRLFQGQQVSGFIQKPYTAKGIVEKVKVCLG